MFASMHQHKSHSRYHSGRNTPRSGTATPGRRPFQEDRNKAVFITGLQKVEGSEYDIYRNKCYSDLQMNMGTSGQRLYVVKFDFPTLADHAFVHLRTERMAQYLLTKKTITLAGEKCKVYNYNREKEGHHEDDVVINIEEAPLKSVTMNPLITDSCYETRLATPAPESRSISRMSEKIDAEDTQAHAGVVAAPPVTRQPSTVDNVLHKEGLDVLQQKLEQISSSQSTPTVTEDWSQIDAAPVMLSAPVLAQPAVPAPVVAAPVVTAPSMHNIVDQITIPEVFDLNTFANLKCQGAQIVSSGLMSAEQFNANFAAIFNQKLREIVGNTLTENLAIDAATNFMQAAPSGNTTRAVVPNEAAVAY